MTPYWRVKWAAVGAGAALALVGLAWLMTSIVKSPQDALAEAAPPPPSRITVPVEKKTLDLDVTVLGKVESARAVSGRLSVDERDKAAEATEILVSVGDEAVSATATGIEADGAFVLKLDEPLQKGADAQVRFVPPAQEEALVVPISALFTMADGDTGVVVFEGDVERQEEVTMGAEAAGFVEISPTDLGTVVKGDLVLVSEPTS